MNKLSKPDEIKKIVVVFKTHLDVGFTDFSAVVKQRYMEDYLPRTIALSQRTSHYTKQYSSESKSMPPGHCGMSFAWTTGSWLIYEALEEYKGKQLKELESAILSGHIAWHGLPFTTHSELMDASLFRFGLSLSEKLDRRFGKKTIAAKMTDVPGHTRAIVPLLAEAGIKMLHIGVNPASTPPDVPDAFVWKHTEDADLTVVYDHGDYGGPTFIPGLSCGLVLAHTGDNLGPPSFDAIHTTLNQWSHDFPNAKVAAGRLDEFANELDRVKESLPVVTQEMGDTWIHGVGTDPGKVAQFRELQRLNSGWENLKPSVQTAKKLEAFRRRLMMIPEHTWGMDEKMNLTDYTHYDAPDLRRMRRSKECKRFESSWQEQRAYMQQAVDELRPGVLHKEAMTALHSLEPRYPETKGFEQVSPFSRVFTTPWLSIGFDGRTGGISHMKDIIRKRVWATQGNPFAAYTYETFSAEDYERFVSQYLRFTPATRGWAIKDFTKPNLEALNLKHQTAKPTLDALWHRTDRSGNTYFILQMSMPKALVKDFGAPEKLTTEIHIHAKQPVIDIVFQWFGKPACRLPEAAWLSFCPQISNSSGWSLRKMGAWISPLDVVKNGNRKLHAVEMIRYQTEADKLKIESLDAPLVAPGEPSLLDFNNRRPPLKKGMHFNLHNNIWGTNFPMWYEEDSRFRFRLDLDR